MLVWPHLYVVLTRMRDGGRILYRWTITSIVLNDTGVFFCFIVPKKRVFISGVVSRHRYDLWWYLPAEIWFLWLWMTLLFSALFRIVILDLRLDSGQSRFLIKVCYKLAAAARSDYKLYFDLCNINLAFFVSSLTFEVPQLYGRAKVNISSSHVFLISY